jgi:hypothetical protein
MKSDEMLQFAHPYPHNQEFAYKGSHCSQRIDVIPALDRLYDYLEKNNRLPVNIVELGSLHTGLTKIFSDHDLSNDSSILSIDIHRYEHYQPINKVDYVVGDMWNPDLYQKIIDKIQEKKTCLLFCDGGDKIREFNTFSQYLKSGDIILAHDYAPDKAKFFQEIGESYWRCIECYDSAIDDAVKNHSLKPLSELNMHRAMWCVFERS